MRTLSLALVLAACLMPAAAMARPKIMNVQNKEGQLRSSPAYFGSVVDSVVLGDSLEVLQKKGTWTEVMNPKTDKTGWIHNSALTKKKIKLKAESDVAMNASSSELALAEKGFNPQVEKAFKEKNKDIDFTWVDKMVKIKVKTAKSVKFLAQGEVKPQEGGAE